MNLAEPLVHLVRLPLGVAAITLDRRGMELEERGGFEARWVPSGEAGREHALKPELEPEAYRAVVKAHLREVYVALTGGEPSAILLNLASHQLLDDLLGWSRLNAGKR